LSGLQNGIIAGQTTKEWFLGEVIKVKEKKKERKSRVKKTPEKSPRTEKTISH